MKKHFSVLILLICMIVSCKKTDRVTAKDIQATIVYSGDISVDGCGWLVKINDSSISYHADNLPETYQTDQLAVIVSYQLLAAKYSCGLISNNLSVIKIDAIRKK